MQLALKALELGFVERQSLKNDLLRHVRDGGDPLQFPGVIQRKLTAGLSLTLITPFTQSRKVPRTPCSSCAPDKPKFWDGALFRDNVTGELIVTGNVCAKKHIGETEHNLLTADYKSFEAKAAARSVVQRHLDDTLALFGAKNDILKLAKELHVARKELIKQVPEFARWIRLISKDHGYFREPYYDKVTGKWETRIAGQIFGTDFLCEKDVDILTGNLFIDVSNLHMISAAHPRIDDMSEDHVRQSASLITSIRHAAITCQRRILSAQRFFAQDNLMKFATATELGLPNGLDSMSIVSGRVECTSTTGQTAVISRPDFSVFMTSSLRTFV